MSILQRLINIVTGRRPVLLCMRLADMDRFHPDQIIARCSNCGEEVAVYPSGQRVMREVRGVQLFCQVCRTPNDSAKPAPGAEEERAESVWRRW